MGAYHSIYSRSPRHKRFAEQPRLRGPVGEPRSRRDPYRITTIAGTCAYALAEARFNNRPPRRPKGIPRRRWRKVLRQLAVEEASEEARCGEVWRPAVDHWEKRIRLSEPPLPWHVSSKHPPLRLLTVVPKEVLLELRGGWGCATRCLFAAQLVELTAAAGGLRALLVWLRWCGVVHLYRDAWPVWRAMETGAAPVDLAAVHARLRCDEDDIPF